MTPRTVFGIVIRAFGLSLLIFSIWYLIYAVATALGLWVTKPGYGTGFAINGITFLVLSLYLLRGAPHVLRFSYPEEYQSNKSKDPGPVHPGNAAVGGGSPNV